MVPLLAKKGRTLTAQMDTQVQKHEISALCDCSCVPLLKVSVNGERFGPRRVYLFSDALVVVQRVRKEKKTQKKFIYVCQLLFESVSVSDVKDGATESGTTPASLQRNTTQNNPAISFLQASRSRRAWP